MPRTFLVLSRVVDVRTKAWAQVKNAFTRWRWLGGRRHPFLVVGLSVGIGAATAILLGKYEGGGTVFRTLGHVDPIWFLVCAGAEVVAYAGYVLALHVTARIDNGPR